MARAMCRATVSATATAIVSIDLSSLRSSACCGRAISRLIACFSSGATGGDVNGRDGARTIIIDHANDNRKVENIEDRDERLTDLQTGMGHG